MSTPDIELKSIEIKKYLRSVGLEFQPSVGLWYSHRTRKFVNTFSSQRTLNDTFTGYTGSCDPLKREDVIDFARSLIPIESKKYNEKSHPNRVFEIPGPLPALEPKSLIVCPVCHSCHDHFNSFKQHRSTYHRGNKERHLEKLGYLIHSEKNFHNIFLICDPPESSESSESSEELDLPTNLSLGTNTIVAMEKYLNSIGLEFKPSVGHWYCFRSSRFINIFMNDGALYLRLTGSSAPLTKRDVIAYARARVPEKSKKYTKKYTPSKLFKIPGSVPGIEAREFFVCPECHSAQTNNNNYKAHRSRHHRGSKKLATKYSAYIVSSLSTHYNILYHDTAYSNEASMTDSRFHNQTTQEEYLKVVGLEFFQSIGLWYSHKTRKFVNVFSKELSHIFTDCPSSFKKRIIDHARSLVPEDSKKYNETFTPNRLFKITGPIVGLAADTMTICPICHSSHIDRNNFINHINKAHGGGKEIPYEKLGYLVHSERSQHNVLFYDPEIFGTEERAKESFEIQPTDAMGDYLKSIELEFFHSVGLWYSHRIGKFINIFSQNSRRGDIFTGSSAPLRKESVIEYTKSLVPTRSMKYNMLYIPNKSFKISGPIQGLSAQMLTVCRICHSTHVDEGSYLHHSAQFHRGEAKSMLTYGYLVHSEKHHNNILYYDPEGSNNAESTSTNHLTSISRDSDEYLKKFVTDDISNYAVGVDADVKVMARINNLVLRFITEDRENLTYIRAYREFLDRSDSRIKYRWIKHSTEETERLDARSAAVYIYTLLAIRDLRSNDMDEFTTDSLDFFAEAVHSDEEEIAYTSFKKGCFLLGSELCKPIQDDQSSNNIFFYAIHVTFLNPDMDFKRPWYRKQLLRGIGTLFKISIIDSFDADVLACNAFVDKVEENQTDDIYFGKFQELTYQHRVLSSQDWGPDIFILDKVGREISVNNFKFGLDNIHSILLGCVQDIERVREVLFDSSFITPDEIYERMQQNNSGAEWLDLKYQWTSQNLSDFIGRHLKNATPEQYQEILGKLQTINDCLFLMIALTCGYPYRLQELRQFLVGGTSQIPKNIRLEGRFVELTQLKREANLDEQASTKYVPFLVSKYIAYYIGVIRPLELELAPLAECETYLSTMADIIDDDAKDDVREYTDERNQLILELSNKSVSQQLRNFLFVGVHGLKSKDHLEEAVTSLINRHSKYHQRTNFETIYESLAYLTHDLVENSREGDIDEAGESESTHWKEVSKRWHYINELIENEEL